MKNLEILPVLDSSSIASQTDSVLNRPDKRFVCMTCQKKFSSKHCLKEHRFTHTGERPYQCLICLVHFKHASQLSVHKKSHKGRQEIIWPKLTDLLKTFCETSEGSLTTFNQPIDLPKIEFPQTWDLPRLSSLNKN